MEKTPDDYHISFFKPTTERAKYNRNMVLWLVSIWFLAIFGFHIILRIIEKPVPEPAYLTFESAWSKFENGTATDADFQELGKSCLSVLGKIDVTPDAKSVLDNAFSWSVYHLYPPSDRPRLIDKIKVFEENSMNITSISDEKYIELKTALSGEIAPLLGLSAYDVRKKMIPFELTSAGVSHLSEETKANLSGAMGKYLIHNQSVLTDFRFLGFPFHYFYTAVFLLVLFVGLCLIYCIKTDAMNKKLEISE